MGSKFISDLRILFDQIICLSNIICWSKNKSFKSSPWILLYSKNYTTNLSRNNLNNLPRFFCILKKKNLLSNKYTANTFLYIEK